jgi:tetratricopeptide (TPR) repeat protein
VPAALAAGRGAVKAAVRAEAADVEAEARMSLAFVLLESGSVAAALHQADLAAGATGGLVGARVATQRALVLQRIGRNEEALAGYAAALPVLRRHRDATWEARLRNNRGLLHAYHGSLRDAEADLQRAMSLYESAGAVLHVASSLSNLGFVAARRGDAPKALACFDEADEIYRTQRRPLPQIQLDRAEVLIGVGLFAEARRTAERAVRELSEASLGLHLAEARLLLAQAAIADGDPATGRVEARAAARSFAGQGRDAWSVLARHVMTRAAERHGDVSRQTLHEALDVADELAGHRWTTFELDARITAATVALARGESAVARRQLELVSSASRSASLSLRLRAAYADALLHLEDGDQTAAERSLRAGTALLDRARTTVGATELRMHVSQHGRDLTALGLRLAMRAGSPRGVLAWSERSRAAALRVRPVVPPRDAEFATALEDLRRSVADLEDRRLAGDPAEALERTVARLESRVQAHARRARGTWAAAGHGTPAVSALAERLDDRCLLELAEVEGQLVALTLVRGRLAMHDLGAAASVTAEATAARTAVRRLASAPDGAADRARDTLLRAGRLLQDAVLAPVVRRLGDRPLVLVPTPALQSVPWCVLPALRDRPVATAPSAATWLAATAVPMSVGGRVLAVAGPRLATAPGEVAAVSSLRDADALTGPDATVQRVMHAMGTASTVHIAAHGRLRSDNPLLSALDLADGPLTVYDLERLPAVPSLVVLPACQSGATAVRAGEEVMGLAHAMLALGSRAVVAALVPVPDAETGAVMVGLHRELAAGLSPAEALARVQGASWDAAPRTAGAAQAFACFGAG